MRFVKTTVLVVDDDPRMVDLMEHILELEGYRVLAARGGLAGLSVLDREHPDLVLLDVQMPDLDGYSVCRRIRETSQVPIIMVTVKDQDEDKIKGLECGADDYVTKPFCVQELTARIKTVLRRFRSGAQDEPEVAFKSGPLTVDFARRRVQLDAIDINLTATEFRLLAYLAKNAGRVVTADQILEKVWGAEYMGDHHLLRVNMARLRQKIGDNKARQFVVTKPGLGYMMIEPDRPEDSPKQLSLDALGSISPAR